jgi:hypothetical protein
MPRRGSPVTQSFEPDEDWFWDNLHGRYINGPRQIASIARGTSRGLYAIVLNPV